MKRLKGVKTVEKEYSILQAKNEDLTVGKRRKGAGRKRGEERQTKIDTGA